MAKVTITESPTDPALLEKLKALAPPPAPGAAAPVVVTPADRLRRAEREHDEAREQLIDESEIEARIDRHSRACNQAEEEIKIHLEEIKILRAKAQAELAEVQGARALKVDNARAAATRARFDRAAQELEAARAAVAEQQAQEAARAAVERERSKSRDEKAADHQERQAGGAEAPQGGPQATTGSGGDDAGRQASQAAQAGGEAQGGGAQASGGEAGQAPPEQQGGQVGAGQAGAA